MPLTIADYKQQNPAYANLDDQVLADGLYQKYYADSTKPTFVPRDKFMAMVQPNATPHPPMASAEVGTPTDSQPSLLSRLGTDVMTGQVPANPKLADYPAAFAGQVGKDVTGLPVGIAQGFGTEFSRIGQEAKGPTTPAQDKAYLAAQADYTKKIGRGAAMVAGGEVGGLLKTGANMAIAAAGIDATSNLLPRMAAGGIKYAAEFGGWNSAYDALRQATEGADAKHIAAAAGQGFESGAILGGIGGTLSPVIGRLIQSLPFVRKAAVAAGSNATDVLTKSPGGTFTTGNNTIDSELREVFGGEPSAVTPPPVQPMLPPAQGVSPGLGPTLENLNTRNMGVIAPEGVAQPPAPTQAIGGNDLVSYLNNLDEAGRAESFAQHGTTDFQTAVERAYANDPAKQTRILSDYKAASPKGKARLEMIANNDAGRASTYQAPPAGRISDSGGGQAPMDIPARTEPHPPGTYGDIQYTGRKADLNQPAWGEGVHKGSLDGLTIIGQRGDKWIARDANDNEVFVPKSSVMGHFSPPKGGK